MTYSVNGTQGAGSTYSSNVQTTTSYDAFGSAQFMQMLMAQLTHQNPLEPMDDSDMMNQFSQLNSLQELQTIKSAVVLTSAYSQTGYAANLIGKTVRANLVDGRQIEGVVTGVSVENGMIEVQIGDETAYLENVVEIKGD